MSEVKCNACGYVGSIDTYKPTASVYSDIRCPKCGSTDNQHNSEYLNRLLARMREATDKIQEASIKAKEQANVSDAAI